MNKKEVNGQIIIKYKQYLRLEKSLSGNTIMAYIGDLEKLLSFLATDGIDILDVTIDNLESFIAGLRDIGIHARSQARILSGIRSFFHFLVIGSREMKSVKHPITTAFLQISLQFIQNPFARELLKITDNISQWKLFPCTDNCM